VCVHKFVCDILWRLFWPLDHIWLQIEGLIPVSHKQTTANPQTSSQNIVPADLGKACAQALKTEIVNQLHHLLVYFILAATYVSYEESKGSSGFSFAGDILLARKS